MKPALAVLFAVSAFAQTGALSPVPLQQPLDNSGRTLGGSCLYSYAAGTTTPQLTYSDAGLTSPNTNPVVINGFGRQPAVYLQALSYKLVLAYPVTGSCPGSPGTVIWSQDNVYDFGEIYKVLLTGPTGAAQIGFQPTGGTLPTTIAAILNQYVYDIGFTSLTDACAAASSKPLFLASTWSTTGTQTLSCNIVGGGGVIQPAASATVTISGGFTCPALPCLDTSLGGAGSIVFSGGGVTPDASWFGASPSAAAGVNILAIQSALRAFPIIAGVYAGNSSGSMTNVPVRSSGMATIGCGAFPVNAILYMMELEELRSICNAGGNGSPTGVTSLNLTNGIFTSGEHFMIEVLPTLTAMGGTPTPNETFAVRITGGLSVNANGFNNAGASCIKIYGAEGSYFDLGDIQACAVRGVIISDTFANDPTFWDNTSDGIKMTVGDITGLTSPPWAVGPGLFVHCQTCDISGPVQHFNGAGTFTGAAVPGGSGTVSTSGSAVTWVSGTAFPLGPAWFGQQIIINSVAYVVSTVNSASSITLATSAGTQTAVAYSVVAEVNPEIQIESSQATTIRSSYGECESRFAEITGTGIAIKMNQVSPSVGANGLGCLASSTTGIRVSASTRGFHADGACTNYTNAVVDLSSTPSGYSVPCQSGFFSPFNYDNNVQIVPNGFLFGNQSMFQQNGSLFVRSEVMTTPATATGSASSGSMSLTVSGVSGTILPGYLVGGTGIAQSTYVSNVSGSTVTLSVATSGPVSGTVTFFTGDTAFTVECANGQALTGNTGISFTSFNPDSSPSAIAAQMYCSGLFFANSLQAGAFPFATIPPVFSGAGFIGAEITITDSTTNTPGATISTGGGMDRVKAIYNGTNWIVEFGY